MSTVVSLSPETRTLKFYQISSLSLAGATMESYTIIFTGTVGSSSTDIKFKLTLSNPCEDENYVWFTVPELEDKNYVLHD